MLEIVLGSVFVGSLGLQALITGSWIYRQQAAIARRHQQEEEELLTDYDSRDDLISIAQPHVNGSAKSAFSESRPRGWEFKIVRANRDLFRDPAVFRQLCAEEAQAGWILLEKLDDRRVRFKRSTLLRDTIAPESLAIDPYRCHYGSTWTAGRWLAAIAFIASMILPAYLGYAFMSALLTKSQERGPGEAIERLLVPKP